LPDSIVELGLCTLENIHLDKFPTSLQTIYLEDIDTDLKNHFDTNCSVFKTYDDLKINEVRCSYKLYGSPLNKMYIDHFVTALNDYKKKYNFYDELIDTYIKIS
jgi:hypothetical protein